MAVPPFERGATVVDAVDESADLPCGEGAGCSAEAMHRGGGAKKGSRESTEGKQSRHNNNNNPAFNDRSLPGLQPARSRKSPIENQGRNVRRHGRRDPKIKPRPQSRHLPHPSQPADPLAIHGATRNRNPKPERSAVSKTLGTNDLPHRHRERNPPSLPRREPKTPAHLPRPRPPIPILDHPTRHTHLHDRLARPRQRFRLRKPVRFQPGSLAAFAHARQHALAEIPPPVRQRQPLVRGDGIGQGGDGDRARERVP